MTATQRRNHPGTRPGPAPALGLLGVAIGVAAWAAASGSGLTDGIPGPGPVAGALLSEIGEQRLWAATAHTTIITLIALGAATVIGLLVGAAVGASPTVRRFLSSSIDTLRFVPPVALIPVVLLLLGFGSGSEIAVATFAAVWPILLGVATSAAELRVRYTDVVRVARLRPPVQLRMIYLPGTVPALVNGVRTGTALALILVIATEVLAVPAGLGGAIRSTGDALDLPTMYAYIVWTGLLGLGLDLITRVVQHRATRGRGGRA